MAWQRIALVMVTVFSVAFGATRARAGEGGGGPGGPPRLVQGPGAGPQVRRPAVTAGRLGDSVPAVREEMRRYRQALRKIAIAHMALAREIDRALRQFRDLGAENEELEAAAKEFAPQARELAEKQAAALTTHYENLAKIYKPDDEAKRKELIRLLAEEIVKRMAARPQPRPQRPPWAQPGGPRFPGRPGEGPPGGPPRRPDDAGRERPGNF